MLAARFPHHASWAMREFSQPPWNSTRDKITKRAPLICVSASLWDFLGWRGVGVWACQGMKGPASWPQSHERSLDSAPLAGFIHPSPCRIVSTALVPGSSSPPDGSPQAVISLLSCCLTQPRASHPSAAARSLPRTGDPCKCDPSLILSVHNHRASS